LGYYIYKIFRKIKSVEGNIYDYTWDSSWDSDNLNGVLGKIVSNYEDLTVPNHKRITRGYLDIKGKHAICGSFSMESDFGTNRSIHADDESSEPDGAVSRALFSSIGQQTWNTGSSFSSGTVENWETCRLDVGVQGRKFRYSIKFGDITADEQEELYIKPPQFDAQIKGKY
jgi:hypothetical protein